MLKSSGGNMTPKQVLCCAQLSGAFGRQLDKVFTKSGLGEMDTRDCRQRMIRIPAYKADLGRFVKEFAADDLCGYKPGRRNKVFRGFSKDRKFSRSAVKLGSHLKHLSKTLDDFRALALQDPVQNAEERDM